MHTRSQRYACDQYAAYKPGPEKAQQVDDLLPIGPGVKCQGDFVCLAANDQRIHRCNKFIVSVRLPTVGRKKVEGPVRPGDITVHARADA